MTTPTRLSLIRTRVRRRAPLICPSCGATATVQVGGRGYCEECAKEMRRFLFLHRELPSDNSEC